MTLIFFTDSLDVAPKTEPGESNKKGVVHSV